MRKRILLALLIACLAIAIFPVKPFNYFITDDKFDLLIANCNENGSSLFYKVLAGKINLSAEKLKNLKNLNKDSIALEYPSLPLTIKNNEVYIKGFVANTLFIESDKRNILSYSIEDWKPQNYMPNMTIWTYREWSIFILLLISNIYLFIKKK